MLHLAQPSLTRQIKGLEEELGVVLLNRTKHQVSLTNEGHSFLIDANRLLNLALEMVQSVQRLTRGEVLTLNVGYVTNLFYDLLPPTLASFRKLFPTVPINLFDMSCGDQFRAIDDGKIALGFVGLHEPIEMRGLQFRTIASYETVVALPEKRPYGAQIRCESQRPCAEVFHRYVGSELSFLSRLAGQDVWRRWFYTEGLAGCRTGTDNDSRGGRRIGCGSRARASKETPSRKCSLPATKANRQNGRLYCMEGRNSVSCSESVRGDCRASGPQHPLICRAIGLGQKGNHAIQM